MNKLSILILIFIASMFFPICNKELNARDKKAKNLYSENFKGWRGINKSVFPEKGWKAENKMIICSGEKGGDIITINEYNNFELTWEWKMVKPGANSGIKYFVKERPGDTGGYGYGIEYQMLDDNDYIKRGQMKPNDYHTTGGAYELYSPGDNKKVNPLGEWNKSKIISKNGHIEHWLNGIKILVFNRLSDDFKLKVSKSKFKNVENFGIHPSGHILLQDHDSEIFFRKVKLKEK